MFLDTRIEHKRSFDVPLLSATLLLWVIGILLIYSATHILESGPLVHVARNQVLWVAMGVLLLLLVVSVPLRFFYSFAYVIFGLSCLLLVTALFMGIVSKGAGRWIGFGSIRIQPSEFAKIGLLLALSRYLSERTVTLEKLTSFIVPGILFIIPFALVMKQPDLGSALVYGAMTLPLFYWAGMPLLDIFLILSPGFSLVLSAIPLLVAFAAQKTVGVAGAVPWGLFFLVLCAVLYFSRPAPFVLVVVVVVNLFAATMTTVLWNSFLKDYQKSRIISVFDPQKDAFGSGYQVIQSMVAIGSGHLTGKGFLQGTQTRLSFLPEQHTDFIFSVLGEQFGLFGCAAVLAVFAFIILRSFLATQMVRNRFSNLVIVGSATIILFHTFVNIAMTLGMMPVTGIPLPYLSYGGSFTFAIAILTGLIINARMGRQESW